ncbi:MAG: 30S ribosomal protein S12 methylthiotransferase RimO [Bacteroidota bacterium]
MVHVITLGCPKNVVDSEKLLAQLSLNGIRTTPAVEEADVAVVNTCGFITAARQESIDVLIGQVRRKEAGHLERVFAVGCLPELHRSALQEAIPEVDGWFGAQDMAGLLRALGGELRRNGCCARVLTTPPHTAYLKIGDGCDRRCSFCTIPAIRGPLASRAEGEVLREARGLVAGGVRELVLVAQDTTSYGRDRGGRPLLAGLLERIALLDGLLWVRVLYGYPAGFPEGVLRVLGGHPSLFPYLDIPLQHAADSVLRSMRRGISEAGIRRLLDRIRERAPGITLRTTLMVGYPAEGPREFRILERFVERERFDRLGVFVYSAEEGTQARALGDPVPPAEKERRREVLMEMQREISLGKNEALVGTVQKVLVDRKEGTMFAGRTREDAPEIDNEVYVRSSRALAIGAICDVAIEGASEYDMYGRATRRKNSRPSPAGEPA